MKLLKKRYENATKQNSDSTRSGGYVQLLNSMNEQLMSNSIAMQIKKITKKKTMKLFRKKVYNSMK